MIGTNKKSLTKFAKDCAWESRALINGLCMSEELVHSELDRKIANGFVEVNEDLILEIVKIFAKYINDEFGAQIEEENFRIFAVLLANEHDWFGRFNITFQKLLSMNI